jgi:hypothetical protein
MSNLAINDKGEALFYDGQDWKPAQMAANDRGERVAFDGKGWVPVGPQASLSRRALDMAGDAASAVGDFTKRAGEYRDTQFAKAMGGVAGMPRMMADAVSWGANKVGLPEAEGVAQTLPVIGPILAAGKMLPTGQEIGQSMIDVKKNAPVPPGGNQFTERSINPIVDAGVQSLFSGPLMGAGGKLGPLVNFGAGAGSETAGEIAHHAASDYETPARILGAVLGGGGAATIPSIVRQAGKVAAPFTAAGREGVAGNALTKMAADPQAALAKLESYQVGKEAFPDAVPGFSIDAGKASRDPGLMGAAEVAASKNPGMRAQYNTNNAIVSGALDRASAGLPDASLAGPIIQDELGKTVEGLEGRSGHRDRPALRRRAQEPDASKAVPAADLHRRRRGREQGRARCGDAEGARSAVHDRQERPVIADRSARGMMATRDALNDMLGQ